MKKLKGWIIPWGRGITFGVRVNECTLFDQEIHERSGQVYTTCSMSTPYGNGNSSHLCHIRAMYVSYGNDTALTCLSFVCRIATTCYPSCPQHYTPDFFSHPHSPSYSSARVAVPMSFCTDTRPECVALTYVLPISPKHAEVTTQNKARTLGVCIRVRSHPKRPMLKVSTGNLRMTSFPILDIQASAFTNEITTPQGRKQMKQRLK